MLYGSSLSNHCLLENKSGSSVAKAITFQKYSFVPGRAWEDNNDHNKKNGPISAGRRGMCLSKNKEKNKKETKKNDPISMSSPEDMWHHSDS